MSIYGLLAFCAVYALAVATPGPGIAAVIARTLTHGFKGAPAFVAGFIIGDLVWFAIAATGLAALAKTAETVFVAIKWAGVVYTMNALTFIEVSLAIVVIMTTVLFSYVFLAARAREMFRTPRAVRRLNRSSDVAMAGAAVVVATR
jgi:threonine/homoserine/homoserine lactone efflux protein